MIIGNAAPEQIEDFTVEFRANGARTSLWVQGVELGEFEVPFTPEQVRSALSDRSPNRVSTDPLVSFGSSLFSSLFAGTVGRKLWERFAEAERSNRGLRLRILSPLERTQHLPWELMFDPSRGDFMSLSGRLALVRTRPDGYDWHTALEPLAKLRILTVTADPEGLMRADEDITQLAGIAAAHPGKVEVTTLRDVRTGSLVDALSSKEFDVFHFAGTGENLPLPKRGGGIVQALRLAGPPNESVLLNRQDLGEMLRKGGIRLAVLNGCETDWVARSLAKYVPAAMGFRDAVRADTCIQLCDPLYRALAVGTPLDLAVTAARQALNRAIPDAGDWCKLIFYLQQPNGTFVASAAQAAQEQPAAVPRQNKEVAALARLLEVYRSNLAELDRGASRSTGSSPAFDERRNALLGRIEDLQRRLAELAPPGTTP